MSNDRPLDLAGVSDAAKAVGLNKSTVSRYVAQSLLSNYGEAGRPLVSLAELRALRMHSLDPAKRRVAAPDLASDGPSVIQPLMSAPPTSSVEATLAGERVRKTRADADRAELENAKAQGQLVEREAAADAGYDLGPALLRLLDERAPDLATALVGVADYRAALAAIQQADHALLEKWRALIETILAEFSLIPPVAQPDHAPLG